jgi:hypothetical protein
MTVAMGDASVRNIGQGISLTSWYAACWPGDGLNPGNDW